MTDYPTLAELQIESHDNAVAHGFWDGPQNIGEKLALIHSEISEALEEYRLPEADLSAVRYTYNHAMPPFNRRKAEGFPVELADAVIRILDLAGYLQIDLGDVIVKKQAYNRMREHMHGKAL